MYPHTNNFYRTTLLNDFADKTMLNVYTMRVSTEENVSTP